MIKYQPGRDGAGPVKYVDVGLKTYLATLLFTYATSIPYFKHGGTYDQIRKYKSNMSKYKPNMSPCIISPFIERKP